VQVHHDEGVANRIDPESCAERLGPDASAGVDLGRLQGVAGADDVPERAMGHRLPRNLRAATKKILLVLGPLSLEKTRRTDDRDRGIEETSASFEARSAPRSYPTPITGLRQETPAACLLTP
jgi:hypothetical protein